MKCSASPNLSEEWEFFAKSVSYKWEEQFHDSYTFSWSSSQHQGPLSHSPPRGLGWTWAAAHSAQGGVHPGLCSVWSLWFGRGSGQCVALQSLCRKGRWKMMVKIKAASRWYCKLIFYLVRSTTACMKVNSPRFLALLLSMRHSCSESFLRSVRSEQNACHLTRLHMSSQWLSYTQAYPGLCPRKMRLCPGKNSVER